MIPSTTKGILQHSVIRTQIKARLKQSRDGKSNAYNFHFSPEFSRSLH